MPAKSQSVPRGTRRAAYVASTPSTLNRKCRREGSRVVWPAGVCERFGIKPVTRWRWERDGRLPKRDAFVNGVAVGWRPETLDAAARGEK